MYCRIHDHCTRQRLSVAQAARTLGLDAKTVARWLTRPRYEPRAVVPRASRLDAFKGAIVRLLDTHAYSAQQVYQRLREDGFTGSLTLVRDYVRQVRPVKRPVYLKLHFEPGEVAQVDWGEWGTIAVGQTRRRLSFFVMVLAHSRLMYVEFCVSQAMEHFLSCHERAFSSFGGVVERVMVDNLKSAVLRRLAGEAPVFNPRYVDFARHYGFQISPCNVAAGNEKGRVESGVGYVKKNFLNGLDLAEFSAVNPAARLWLDTIANVRVHGETRERPVDSFEKERGHLRALNRNPYDCARILNLRASSQFRFTVDTNHYSVPPDFAYRCLVVKVYPDRVCAYYGDRLIARHVRSYERHKDIEIPDHAKALVAQRGRARDQRLMVHFLALSPNAAAYYQGLEPRRANARLHVRKILALAEIYGAAEMERAIDDGLAFQAFSAEYVTNILEMRSRKLPETGPLQLTRHQDLLEIELPAPDLSAYEDQDEPT